MVFPTFTAWAATFGKVYNGDDEFTARKAIYDANIAMFEAHNADDSQTFTMGPNQFTDLTREEFKALNIFGFKNMKDTSLPRLAEVHDYHGEDLATSMDWRSKGAVTPVKNQGQCGSCWAFSTVGGLEGAWQINTGSLTSMSEQQLVDCSKQNSGCNGGLMDYAFEFEEGVNVATESSYPYTAQDGTCRSSGYTTAIPQGGVTGYVDVAQSTTALQSALQIGPLSVAIEADQSAFQYYSGGVITSGCGTSLDHGVTAVGYSSDYFIVKNSWGSSWGVDGYVNIAGSQCGITQSASYPTVQGSGPVPTPTPSPSPSPSPSPACTDTEDSYYCDYVVEQQWCADIGVDCLKSCGCCDDPTLCGASVDQTMRAKAKEAMAIRV